LVAFTGISACDADCFVGSRHRCVGGFCNLAFLQNIYARKVNVCVWDTCKSLTAAPFRPKPSTIGEKLQSVQFVPEPTISEKLRKIDWFQFEKLVEMIYEHRGFTVKRLGGANPDGGVDLIVESPHEKFVVQCKHWRKWTVGVRHIREFLGTLTDSKIPKGIFITLVGYSADAKQLAEKHGIQILDESDIVVMLVESGLMYSKEVSKLFADERKFCPKCERAMVMRTARKNGNKFWGCSNYPRCKFILNFEG